MDTNNNSNIKNQKTCRYIYFSFFFFFFFSSPALPTHLACARKKITTSTEKPP